MSILLEDNRNKLCLGPQVHLAQSDWTGVLEDVSLDDCPPLPFFKPARGFWTSSLISDKKSAWTLFEGQYADFDESEVYYFEIVNEPQILVLRGNEDVDKIMGEVGQVRFDLSDLLTAENFDGRPSSVIDKVLRLEQSEEGYGLAWQWIGQHYDAVHVPVDFNRRSALQTWDVESTVWFRPSKNLKPVLECDLSLPLSKRP